MTENRKYLGIGATVAGVTKRWVDPSTNADPVVPAGAGPSGAVTDRGFPLGPVSRARADERRSA